MTTQERFRGCLLGLAVGDAVGMVNEFKQPGSFKPITDMMAGGPFDLPLGSWTDDTSMALCMAHSLIEKRKFDPKDQMDRYCRWVSEGYLSSTGHCFDVGSTVSEALRKYRADRSQPYAGSVHPHSAGNGSLMRLAPAALAFFDPKDPARARNAAYDSSMTTHAAVECLDACDFFAFLLWMALNGNTKNEVLDSRVWYDDLTPKIRNIAKGSYKELEPPEIRGTGYVVNCLEAALWAFDTTKNFRDCILAAANLGNDADTTAAVAGQIAGAFYGESGIPLKWLDKLWMRHMIAGTADDLLELSEELRKVSA